MQNILNLILTRTHQYYSVALRSEEHFMQQNYMDIQPLILYNGYNGNSQVVPYPSILFESMMVLNWYITTNISVLIKFEWQNFSNCLV